MAWVSQWTVGFTEGGIHPTFRGDSSLGLKTLVPNSLVASYIRVFRNPGHHHFLSFFQRPFASCLAPCWLPFGHFKSIPKSVPEHRSAHLVAVKFRSGGLYSCLGDHQGLYMSLLELNRLCGTWDNVFFSVAGATGMITKKMSKFWT